jgi:hypothetical protein
VGNLEKRSPLRRLPYFIVGFDQPRKQSCGFNVPVLGNPHRIWDLRRPFVAFWIKTVKNTSSFFAEEIAKEPLDLATQPAFGVPFRFQTRTGKIRRFLDKITALDLDDIVAKNIWRITPKELRCSLPTVS